MQARLYYKNKNKLDTIVDSVQDIMNTLLIIKLTCEAKKESIRYRIYKIY